MDITVMANYELKCINGSGPCPKLKCYPNFFWNDRGFLVSGRTFEPEISRLQSNSCNQYTALYRKF